MKARAVKFVPRKRRPPTKGASSFTPYHPGPSVCPKCGGKDLQWKCVWCFVRRRCLACDHQWIDQEETEARNPTTPESRHEFAARVALDRVTGWKS